MLDTIQLTIIMVIAYSIFDRLHSEVLRDNHKSNI